MRKFRYLNKTPTDQEAQGFLRLLAAFLGEAGHSVASLRKFRGTGAGSDVQGVRFALISDILTEADGRERFILRNDMYHMDNSKGALTRAAPAPAPAPARLRLLGRLPVSRARLSGSLARA